MLILSKICCLIDDFGKNIKSKKECGRPLGLRYKAPNFIYLIDAYHGLFKIDLNTSINIKKNTHIQVFYFFHFLRH